MNLNDLPANELSRIDAVCMEYENRLRTGDKPDIESLVGDYRGEHAALLRRELELVRDEIASEIASTESGLASQAEASDDSNPPLIEVNTSVGHFLIGDVIGRGGMGMVFAATDQRLNRKVAIKMLAVRADKRQQLTERFDREARALANLSHPNIVKLFDVGVFKGLPYAVMEFLDGELLSHRLQSDPLTASEVRSLGAAIADALAAAHRADVVHRDLKPENIMLLGPVDASGEHGGEDSARVKLFDFGLSRAPHDLVGDGFDGQITDVAQTAEGVILGTPGYMAPEQVRGQKVTPAADIFSLGCVLFECFYGHRPFDGRTHAKRFAATLHEQPETNPVRRRDDPALAELIDECLEKDPRNRPEFAKSIALRLREPSSAEPTKSTSHRRQWMIAGSLAIAAAATAPIWMRRKRESLRGIQSLAVLSITSTDGSSGAADPSKLPPPIGDKPLSAGEKISALLVHELTRLSDLSVPRFRPLVVETPEQFRSVGEQLEVDALLTGSMRTIGQGDTAFAEIDLQIISTSTGTQLWGKRFQSEAPDNLLRQSQLVSEIASVIGHGLTATADESAPPTVDSFHCLVDGQARSDPDSPEGLEKALRCFRNAKKVDRQFVAPVAGLALTSITLAGQTDIERAIELVRQARENADDALRRDPNSVDARLASAMLDWQTVGRFDQAERTLRELVVVAPNHWQVRHQAGLLQLTIGNPTEAKASLQQAQWLNPVSVIARVDMARARWLSGETESAISEAKRIASDFENNELARGLLIDIFEHLEDYTLAASEQGLTDIGSTTDAKTYFAARERTIESMPYGPFGPECNRAILQLRKRRTVEDEFIARLSDPRPPMLTFVLAVHPAFARARLLPSANELLPRLDV